MKNVKILCFGLVFLLSVGCSPQEKLEPEQVGIAGTWRLHEYGWSPGSGYNVVSVPASPLQTLTFTRTGEVYRQGEQLKDSFFQAPYYRIDTVQSTLRLFFLKDRKDNTNFANRLEIKGDSMRIMPPCIEGCHYSFVRIRE